MEQMKINKNITHELFEMVDGMVDQLSDKNIKDLKEKIGEVHNMLEEQSRRINVQASCIKQLKAYCKKMENYTKNTLQAIQVKWVKAVRLHKKALQCKQDRIAVLEGAWKVKAGLSV